MLHLLVIVLSSVSEEPGLAPSLDGGSISVDGGVEAGDAGVPSRRVDGASVSIDGGADEPGDAGVPSRRFDIVPLPALGFDSQLGVIFGANVGLYWRAPHLQPFEYAIAALAIFTTGGAHDHSLRFTAVDFLGSGLRPSVLVGYVRELYRNFYGIGNSVSVTMPGDPGWNPTFHSYTFDSLYGALDVERPFATHFVIGARYQLRSLDTKLYEGSLLAAMRPNEARLLRNGELHLDLGYDSRDVEASPTRGLFLQAGVRFSHAALASESSYVGAQLQLRGYWSLFGLGPRLVVAARLLFDVLAGDVPVALLPTFTGRTHYLDGVGGANSVRGLLRFKYVGKMKALGNLELRSRLLRFLPFGREFDIWAVGFVDVGRAWAEVAPEGGPFDFHPAFGGGLRFTFVTDFVLRVDYGSGEGNHAFAVVIENLF